MADTRGGRLDTALLITATTLGSLPIAGLVSAAVARYLPISEDARLALAFALCIPLWVAVMCVTLLSRSGARALSVCIALSMALAVLVLGWGR